MKNTVLEVTEDALIVMGVAMSIDQIKTILGIVLLCIQIGLIIFKSAKVIYNKVKNKDYDGAIKTATDTVDKINEEIKKNANRDNTK